MRYKFSLLVLSEVSGDVLPISYQYELSNQFRQLLLNESEKLSEWLKLNNFTLEDFESKMLYCISNLYIPKIMVQGDRLQVCAPRIQFWVSTLVDFGTKELFEQIFLNKEFSLGDSISSVTFRFVEVDDVSSVVFNYKMEYQSLSPIVVKALRPNQSLEYLAPQNPYFGKFLVDDLIERWENFYQTSYYGNRKFRFTLLAPERRKSVTISSDKADTQKAIGFMIKFRLEIDPELQHFAYVAGVGDDIKYGFGYLELIRKHK